MTEDTNKTVDVQFKSSENGTRPQKGDLLPAEFGLDTVNMKLFTADSTSGEIENIFDASNIFISSEELPNPRSVEDILYSMLECKGGKVVRPKGISPRGFKETVSYRPTLVGSEFKSNLNLERKTRVFQVTTGFDLNYDTPIFTLESDSDILELPISLDGADLFQWRIKDIDALGNESEWSVSQFIKFKVVSIRKPVLSVLGGSRDVGSSLDAILSQFEVINGLDKVKSSEWILEQYGKIVWSTGKTEDVKSASIPSGILEEAQDYFLKARYESTNYGYSEWATISISTKKTFSSPPEIVTPLNGAKDFIGVITLDYDYLAQMVEWEISKKSDFSELDERSYKGTENLGSFIPEFILNDDNGETFFVRARHITNSAYTDWSDPVVFTLPKVEIEAPVIESVLTDAMNLNRYPGFVTSEFKITGVEGVEHTSTDWEILKDDEVVWSNYNTSGSELTAITIVTSVLLADTFYTIRARHVTEDYGYSSWGRLYFKTKPNFLVNPAVSLNIDESGEVSVLLNMEDSEIDSVTWEASTGPNFLSIMDSFTSDETFNTWKANFDPIEHNGLKIYYRVKYLVGGIESPWNYSNYLIPRINLVDPEISLVGETISFTPTFNLSAVFTDYLDSDLDARIDYVDWKVYKLDTIIHEVTKPNESENTFAIPEGLLTSGTEYIVRARATSLKFGETSWVSYTIATEDLPVEELGNLDPSNLTIVQDTLPLAGMGHGMSGNGKEVFIAHRDGARLTVLDGDNLNMELDFSLEGNSYDTAFDERFIYVAHNGGAGVTRVSLETLSPEFIDISVSGTGYCVEVGGTNLFVGHSSGSYMTVFNKNTGDTVFQPQLAGAVHDIHIDGDRIYIAHENGKFLTVLDSTTYNVVENTIQLDGTGRSISSDDSFVYVAHDSGKGLSIFDKESLIRVEGTPSIIGNGRGVSLFRNYLFVTHTDGNRLTVFDKSTWLEETSTPAIEGSGQGVFVDKNRVFVTHVSGKYLTVMETV